MDESGQEADQSTAIHVGEGGRVGDITVQGDVAGRDIIKITEELTYDVSDLGHNPYLGLASYSYGERAFYGGREPQIRDAVARLTAPGDEPVVLFVTGASGSGKSSLAQAGLLPALEEAYTAQGRQVRWSVMRPGRHPLAAFARVLGELGFSEPSDGDWIALLRTPEDLNFLLATHTPSKQINVLILDQFEELFTQAEPAERDTMCGLLSGLDKFEQVHTHVIATLRADYLSALFGEPALFERAKQDGIDLRAMSSEELARSIRRPIQEEARLEDKDKRLEPALVERLVEDVGDDPSLLPLLQVTLRTLWDEPPHRMVLARYQSLTSTLEQQANQLIDQDRQGHERAAAEREQLLGILLDLVEVSLDDDPKRDVRRALPKQAVLQGHPERTGLIEELVNARLLTTWGEQRDQTSVEMIDIIHETLLRNWSRLREAIAAQREALQQRERFRLALHEWIESSRSDRYLLQGVRLAEGRSLAEQNDVVLWDPDGRAFLEQSTHAEAEARTRELRQARRRQWILGTVAAVAVVAAGLAFNSQQQAQQQTVLAQNARDDAISQAKLARSRQLAAQAIGRLADRPDLALLLAGQSYRTAATIEARSALLSTLQFSPSLVAYFHGHTDQVTSVAFSPDGKTLAAGGDDTTVRLWDVASRQPLGASLVGHSDYVTSVAFSPDSSTLASGSTDKTVRLWDVTSRQPLGEPLDGGTGTVGGVAFSPDGTRLASASDHVRLWNAASRQLVGPLLAGENDSLTPVATRPGPSSMAASEGFVDFLTSVVFSPDSKTLASASSVYRAARALTNIQLWDVGSRQPLGDPLAGGPGGVYGVAFSLDGKFLAAASHDDSVRLFEVANISAPGKPLTGHTNSVTSVAFSPDGKTLASGSWDKTVRLWDFIHGAQIGDPLTGHTDSVTSVAFSPDGKMLASASADHTVRLWSLTSPQPLSALIATYPRSMDAVALNPSGQTLASASDHLQLWDARSGYPLGPPLTDRVTSVAFSPDGKTLASGSDDNSVWLWDVTARQAPEPHLTGHSRRVSTLTFSPDGATLASASVDKTVRLWDVARRQPRGAPLGGSNDEVNSLAFSPDGKVLATAGADHTLRLWDVASQQPLGEFAGHTLAVSSVAFSPDGKTLASGSNDRTVRLWDVASHQPLGDVLSGHSKPVDRVAFSLDGKTLASSSSDGTIRLWDVASRQPLGPALSGYQGYAQGLVFSADGNTLASISDSEMVRLWDINPDSWLGRICRIANRNMTPAEWITAMGSDVPYQRTCPDLPPGDGAPPEAQ